MDRYAGRPFVRLLECYVLDAIDQLDEGQRRTLRSMEPKLASTYGTRGRWQDIVSAQMAFPDAFPTQLRALWARSLDLARERGQSPDPQEFAVALVDKNFVPPAS